MLPQYQQLKTFRAIYDSKAWFKYPKLYFTDLFNTVRSFNTTIMKTELLVLVICGRSKNTTVSNCIIMPNKDDSQLIIINNLFFLFL